MTTERWDDERLDRLAGVVEANSRDIAQLTADVQSLVAIAQAQQQSLASMQQGFEILVQEIRGLRTENRRILDHLFGQQEGGEQ